MKIALLIAVSDYSHIDALGRAALHSDYVEALRVNHEKHGVEATESRASVIALDVAQKHKVRVATEELPSGKTGIVFYDGISGEKALELLRGSN